jgi:hydrogenase expression/formation protein HypE
VCGTVNDVAMMGAVPVYLSAGFILEEGLEIEVLDRVMASMRDAAAESGVQIAAGDTKVVEQGKGDGLYINTAGIGILSEEVQIAGDRAQPGDVVIVSGPIGDHGIAVLSARGNLGIDVQVESDCAPLNRMVAEILTAHPGIHVLRDPTRGGVATSLNEIARQSNAAIRIDETALPIREPVAAACEMLGFDPLYIANEGKLIAIVAPDAAETVLTAIRRSPYGQGAACIGVVCEEPKRLVWIETVYGSTRVLDMPSGELLPRIC